MGFSTSGTFALVAFGTLVAMSMVMGVTLNVTEQVSDARAAVDDRSEAVRETDFRIRKADYYPANDSSPNITIEVENTGGVPIDADGTDLLLDGELQATVTAREVDGDSDNTVWATGERLRYELGQNTPERVLIAGPHGLKRFRWLDYVEDVVWETSDDWDSALAEERVVHETFSSDLDRRDGQVQLGYSSTAPGTPNLIAYWPMDDPNGDVEDVANGNNATATSGVAFDQPGLLSTTALEFGGGEHLDGVDADPENSDFSFTAWVNFDTTTSAGTDHPIFDDYDGANTEGVSFRIQDVSGNDQPAIWIGDGNTKTELQADDPDFDLATDRWHFVAATYDGSQLRVFHDGTKVGETDNGGFTPNDGNTQNADSVIGANAPTDPNQEFDGTIEDLRVYDTALSPSEVTSVYNVNESGFLNTGAKSYSRDYNPADLRLGNINATVPADTSVSVYVRSSPDGDTTFEEESDEIVLDTGTNQSYEVTGLDTPSDTYALSIQFGSDVPDAPLRTPTVNTLDLIVEASASRETIP